MDTLIFPGYSPKNKSWAEEIKKELDNVTNCSIIYWPHWETEIAESGWIDKEVAKILITIGEQTVNILAKSIGTLAVMKILKEKPNQINKLMLCGIYKYDFHPGDEIFFEVLKDFPADRFLCIQNENDNHGSFSDVEKFLHSINPNLKIISKPRSDHEYPYLDKFIQFFK